MKAKEDSRKTVRLKIQFIDRLNALALLGQACHWFAKDREPTGTDSGSNQSCVVVNSVQGNAFRRIVSADAQWATMSLVV
jgi:hypothetical protein